MPHRILPLALFIIASLGLSPASGTDETPRALRVLFLGDQGHHRPVERFRQIDATFAERGVSFTYTEQVQDLNAENLAGYDALLLYANIDEIEPAEEKALLDYVAGGGGFAPIHCASYCFRNSTDIVALIGAQFASHATGVFRERIAAPDHPIMRDFAGFESWDETYVHTAHNEKNRTVLSYRVDGDAREPWTWVRTHGEGRVFYTAWGHDERTWGNAGFQNLLERGLRWAAGDEPARAGAFRESNAPSDFTTPAMTPPRRDVEPFEYRPAKIAYYPPGDARAGDGEWNQMQQPLTVEESQKHFVTPVGFRVELFASEPEIGKPIAMNWDERGRLWIIESVDYPNEAQPEGSGRDRIKICEDVDGDGRADKFTVFADKLSIPTSLAFARGGVIVHQAPNTLFLQDTDGDDRADHREVLFSGWGTSDTHAGPSNMQYGHDNWIWGVVGYAGFNGSVGGEALRFSQGFCRFKPDGSKLEFVRSTNNNTWGLGLSEEGIVFGSTANRNPSVHMPIANRYYEAVRGWSAERLGGVADTHLFRPITDKVRQVDHHGGFTAGAGHALYTARAYPPMYWNQTAFVAGPTGHLVGVFHLMDDGADFRSTCAFNLLASDDEWTAPTMAEVGPDGQVWVIDWYNYIVQHNPTPVGFKTGKGAAYETDLRDKTHGRIYRVVYDDAPAARPTSLANASPQQLLDALASDNLFWRRHAQRLLVERGELDVLPSLIRICGDQRIDAIGLNAAAIHALWTMHGLGALDGAYAEAETAARAALAHPSAGVRRAAVGVLPRNAASTDAILDGRLLDDENAQVRLAALLALAESPASQAAGEAVARLPRNPRNARDRWLIDAVTSAAAAHDVHFLIALARDDATTGDSSAALDAAEIVAAHYARGERTPALAALVHSLTEADGALAETIVRGLASGWPQGQRVAQAAEWEQDLEQVLDRLSAGGKARLVKLAMIWDGGGRFEEYARELESTLLKIIGDESRPDAERLAAARECVAFRSDSGAAARRVLDAITPRTSPELAAGLLDALADSTSDAVGPAVVERFASLTPSAKTAAAGLLLARPAGTQALLDAASDRTISLAELSLDQKQSLLAHPSEAIRARAEELLSQGGGLPDADRQKVLDALMPLAAQQGDVALGKVVFKAQCAKCHVHGGEGTPIGPDLTGMAVHPKTELLAAVIDPSRSVEGNYRVYTVALDDGRVLSGLLASETKTTIELYDAEGKKHVVQRAEIDELAASTKSLMPEGFEKQVPPADIVNLLEFLTERGRFLPLDLAKVATVVSTQGMFHDKRSRAERLVFPDWSPKTFDGVPFHLVDPQGDRTANVVMLHGPLGALPPTMPKSVTLPTNAPATAIHFLSGVSGWGATGERSPGTVSMIVRLHYADGLVEDHPLLDGRHFADYIGPFDVPESKQAFLLDGRQIRYLVVNPKRRETIRAIDLVKGPDRTAPLVMAVTLELPTEAAE